MVRTITAKLIMICHVALFVRRRRRPLPQSLAAHWGIITIIN